jgi:hypothetical protein
MTVATASSAAVVVCVMILTGCGGKQAGSGTDEGGFAASERTAAQTALDSLNQTAVATTAMQNTGDIGYPTICTVHLVTKKPLAFRVFLAWKATTRRWYSWLQASIGPSGLAGHYSFRAGNEASATALNAHVGNALNKPFEYCEITNAGTFSLIPFAQGHAAHPGRGVK